MGGESATWYPAVPFLSPRNAAGFSTRAFFAGETVPTAEERSTRSFSIDQVTQTARRATPALTLDERMSDAAHRPS